MLPGYSSATHTLRYVLRKADGGGNSLTFAAQPDGANSYTVTLPPGLTAGITGQYQLTGYVTDDATGGEVTRQVVYTATVTIRPDPLTQGGDRRTFYQQMVDTLRAALLALSKGELSSTTVNGKSYNRRQLAEVRVELARFEELLRQEEGGGVGQNIYIRFGRPF
jgi:hypothetical protein